jgi:hypothetical protein
MKARCILILVVAFAASLAVSAASASLWDYEIQKPLVEFGHINQNATDDLGNPLIVNGNMACGPTATVNSFIYLQNHYGVHLNVDPDDPYPAVNELGGMMGLTANGVTVDGFITGKNTYLDTYAPEIIYKWQTDSVVLGQAAVIPDWWFIFSELKHCEDVEVCFEWVGSTGGHCVTATSFYFKDDNNNMVIDVGETARMDFIDPWGGVEIPTSTLTMGTDGYLYLSYVGGGAPNGGTGRIILVATESIPEPATIVVWSLLGLVGYCVWRRRRAS